MKTAHIRKPQRVLNAQVTSQPRRKKGRPRKTDLSRRQMAAIKLSQLYRVAKVHREAGEILDPAPWLKVMGNILSSAPSGLDGEHTQRHAPQRLGLSVVNLGAAMARCGFAIHELTAQIEAQVLETQAWRQSEAERTGRPHYVAMSDDTIGKLLGVTNETRQAAKAWNIGTLTGSPQERREAARERDRLRKEAARRKAGRIPRQEYEAASLSQTKPWEAAGIKRPTWYRQKRANETSVSEANKAPLRETGVSETGVSVTNKGTETGVSETNINTKGSPLCI